MKTGKNIKGALNYNEQKIRQGTAELILASNFSRDVSEMGFSEKLSRFQKIIELNEKSQTNTLHLSLNFSPDDDLDTEKIQQIAKDYMTRIGFHNQPYLVYQHNDTTHPHIHIVTTTIRPNGKCIYLHNIGKRLSEPARKAIEEEYGLIKAESRKKAQTLPLQPISLQAAYYGKSETKRIISNIVQEVVARYRFTSLSELNAVLRQYNVIADRGSINSRMYQNRGLVYCIIDKDGYKTGIPIKASAIYSKPTLTVLERKFLKNQQTKTTFQKIVQNKISTTLAKSTDSENFIQQLRNKKIGCSIQYGTDRNITSIQFVDHSTKSVFSCQELGFSITGLLNKLSHPQAKSSPGIRLHAKSMDNTNNAIFPHYATTSLELIKSILTAEVYQPDLSPEFLKKKKKKRKR